jgi:hypothetical protein
LKRILTNELTIALLLIVVLSAGYVLVARRGIPSASGLFGHSLGVIGFVLMLATETLYSLRKRWKGFHYGPMRRWLQVHIVTGLVGPFLVLLHTGWKFQGLAGLTTLLLLLVVASGFFGHYLFTAIPRTIDGTERAIAEVEEDIVDVDRRLRAAGVEELGQQALDIAEEMPQSGMLLVLTRSYWLWRLRRRLTALLEGLSRKEQKRANELVDLLVQRQRLRFQLASLAAARRLLALWHLFHIPLGGVLFTLAFIHVYGALYYGTFLRW